MGRHRAAAGAGTVPGAADTADPALDGQLPHMPLSRAARRRVMAAAGTVLVLAVSVAVAVLVRTFLLQSFWIPSASMEPTLHGCPGCRDDRVLVDKAFYSIGGIDRGEVVVFTKPAAVPDNEKYLIKRVIGLGGETVSARAGRVIIDDHVLIEDYVNPACGGTADFGPVEVPDDAVFVMGDNRCNSLDGRFFGAITGSSIVGRAFMIVWPLDRVRWL